MQKFEWMATAELNFRALWSVGLWPRGETGKFYKHDFYTLYAIFNAIILIGLQNLSQIINIFFVYSDLAALASTCFVVMSNMLGIAKMLVFVCNIRKMKQLTRMLNSHQFQPKSEAQVKLVQPLLKLWKRFYISWGSYVSSCMVLWLAAPLMHGGHELVIPAWYPFSLEKPLNYAFAYVYQTVGFMYSTVGIINVDTLIYALLMYICAQCDLLCDNLGNLDGNEEEFNGKFISCVKHYELILRFAKITNNVFNPIILGQFGTSALTIALTLFQLSLVDHFDTTAVISIVYVLGLAVELYVFCWYGNEIEIKTSKIPYCIYSSNWIDISLGVNKNIFIFVERCQKPLKITAINLFDLSLKTFVVIIRSSWSYFALLSTVHKRLMVLCKLQLHIYA
ncbi:hypothetical protein Zmor_007674 [Zophobas morio]|uniref:Odorant receptor n=1 Tax=Zophobas morio TaxID=2755281 RepID=A0AA38IX69_9CUCU|nr:hypothetical protein Zmor_007674 [Zophobas morio]